MTNNNQIDNTSYYRLPCGKYLEDWMYANRVDFALGSAIKYIYRAGHKDGESKEKDISKSMHYVKFIAKKLHKLDCDVIADINRMIEDAKAWNGRSADMEVKFQIKVQRINGADWQLAADCARCTAWKSALGHEPSDQFKEMLVKSEHSPLRCVMYRIDMIGIPTFVSVHYVRHKFGVEHFVSSNRIDRNGGNADVDRMTPVNHIMICNAQELLFMARRRLCKKASPETRQVMLEIKSKMALVDPVMTKHMVPMCLYRGGCNECVPCYKEEV